MPVTKPDDLMRALLAKINEIITGGDNNVPTKSKTHYVSWCRSGMPFTPQDFEFCTQGITGVVKPASKPVAATAGGGADVAVATGPATDINGDTDATKTVKLIGQAADFSLFVDYIPEKSATYNTSQERLSKICENVLRMSKVANLPISKEEQAKMNKFRSLMYKQEEKENIVTGEKTLVTVESPMMVAYNECMQAYEDAILLYNAKRVNAAAAVDRAAVLDFATNASIYYNKVKAAQNAWVSKGYKNEVEAMNSFINGIGRRNLSLWRDGLIDNMSKAKLTDPTSGSDFYYTSIFPRNFATSKSWLQFNFSEGEYNSYSKKEVSRWGASGGLGFGLWRAQASAGGMKEEGQVNVNMANFSMSFDLTQVSISRPWAPIEFFSNRGWTLEPGAGWTFAGGKLPLSTGGDDPSGPFIAYPTSAIFVRNVVIRFNASQMEQNTLNQSFSGGGSVGWGPFQIGGSYSKGKEERKFNSQYKNNEIRIDGMTLIGFVNKLVGKVPDLDPSIPKNQLQS